MCAIIIAVVAVTMLFVFIPVLMPITLFCVFVGGIVMIIRGIKMLVKGSDE